MKHLKNGRKGYPTGIEVSIEKIVYGGLGLARHNGQVFLIPFAASGDRLLVEPAQEKKGYTLAHIKEILEPSLQRRTPACAYFQVCGGCQLQHLTYAAQREAKTGFIRESLMRLGGIDWSNEIPMVYSEEFNYRLRAQLKLGVNQSRVQIGYFKPESYEFCEVTSCPLLSPALNDVLNRLHSLKVDEVGEAQTIDLIEGLNGQLALHPAISRLASDNVEIMVGEFRYQVEAGAFFQVNRFLLEEMSKLVVSGEQGKDAVDLYSGVGFFTIQLATSFMRIFGVESSLRATHWAELNAQKNGCSNARFWTGQVQDWLQKSPLLKDKVDLVVVDPPRAGLTRKVIASLLRWKPERMIYVSCNPTTLARDLKHLIGGGYTLATLTAIDLFPQTFHIETVAKLVRD